MTGWSGLQLCKTWIPALIAALTIGVLTIGVLWVVRRYGRFRRSRIAKRALSAERAALTLLIGHGYTVLGTQVKQVWPVHHGAHQLDIQLRADAIVCRGKRTFIAEVKSSSLVADLKHGPTRRQLLEYAVAYGADGVLLIDMYAQRVEEIVFPGLSPSRHSQRSAMVACGTAFVLGLCFSGLLWLLEPR